MASKSSQKTWAQLNKMAAFDFPPPCQETYKAIQQLQNLPYKFFHEESPPLLTNSALFFKRVVAKQFEDDPAGMGEIIWDDVVFTLKSLDAPALPEKVSPNGGYEAGEIILYDDSDDELTAYPYGPTTADNWLDLAKSKQGAAMLLVVSRCFDDRASLISNRLLQSESDWWLKLAVNDARWGMTKLQLAAKLPLQKAWSK